MTYLGTVPFMITLSFKFDGDDLEQKAKKMMEDQMRRTIQNKLTFAGSEQLKVTITFGNDGKGFAAFDGPEDVKAEAKRRWETR